MGLMVINMIGVISGGTSYVSMNHMGHRLSEVLRESIFYTEADYNKDYKNICNAVYQGHLFGLFHDDEY